MLGPAPLFAIWRRRGAPPNGNVALRWKSHCHWPKRLRPRHTTTVMQDLVRVICKIKDIGKYKRKHKDDPTYHWYKALASSIPYAWHCGSMIVNFNWRLHITKTCEIYKFNLDGGMISLPDLENLIFLSLGNCPAIWGEVYLNLDRMILANLAIFFQGGIPSCKNYIYGHFWITFEQMFGNEFFRSSEKYGHLNT